MKARALLAVIVLTACSQNQGDVGSPSSSGSESPNAATATATASLAGTPTATPRAAGALGPDGIGVVVTNDLVVRSLPEISEQSEIDPVYLQEGQHLFILDGPVKADGYDWYNVVPFETYYNDTPPVDIPPAIGWSAAGAKDGEVWISPFSGPCIDPDEDPSHWRPGLLALACYDGREITVEGELVGCAGVVLGAVTPGWLAEGGCELIPSGYDPLDSPLGPNNLVFRAPPDGPMVPSAGMNPRLRVTGHLDDAAAQECVASPVYGSPTQPAEVDHPKLAVLGCRAVFVATRIEVL